MPTPSSSPTSASRAAAARWLALQRRVALRPESAAEVLRRASSAESPPAELDARPGPRDHADALRLERSGARLLPMGHPDYPPRLARLPDAPAVLTVAGARPLASARCIAIVGSRAATRAGLRMARRLAGDFARAGAVVVSGLARGIDAAAHEGALDAGGATFAVQACGLEQVYPAGHRALARRIEEAGARLTEFPFGTPALPHHFPLRNRLISGLCEAVVVVEARRRSGTGVTARHAADQGVDVFAVPGPVDSPAHAGALSLLRDGAGIVLEAADVLSALRPPLELPAEPTVDEGPARNAPRAPLSAAAERVLRLLSAGPLTRDELARRLGGEADAVALPILELELAGRIEEERDGRLRRTGGGT